MHRNGVHNEDEDDGGNVVEASFIILTSDDAESCRLSGDQSLSIILSEEADGSHIFGEQSLLTVSVDLSLQPRRASFQCFKSSKPAAWHGSCTSFYSSNSDILNLSSSLNESNVSTWHLTLNKLDHTLRSRTPAESHSTSTKTNQKTTTMNSESRFSSSFLIPECSDLSPRKPKHDDDYDIHNNNNNDDDDGDENDAGFTEIITENPYEVMLTTLTETMTIMEEFSQVPDSTSLSNEHSSRNHNIPHPSVTMRPSEATAVLASDSTGTRRTEDKTPQRPMRHPSPTPIQG